MPVEFVEVEEFQNDLHRLRKYRHLEEDLIPLRKVLALNPADLSCGRIVKISEKHRKFQDNMFKVKKFHSQDMPKKGSRSGFRIIYHYDNPSEKVTFLQIYYKEKENADYDRKRLEKYFPIEQEMK